MIDDIISLESSFNDDIITLIDSGLQLPSTVRTAKKTMSASPFIVSSFNMFPCNQTRTQRFRTVFLVSETSKQLGFSMNGLFSVKLSAVVGVNMHFWHCATIRRRGAAWAG